MDFLIYYLKLSIDILLHQPPFESAQLILFVAAKPRDITFKSAQFGWREVWLPLIPVPELN